MMVRKEDVVSNIIKILNISHEHIDQEVLSQDIKEFGVDSLKIISLIIELEKLYQIDFKPQDLSFDKMRSISSISDCVLSYINK